MQHFLEPDLKSDAENDAGVTAGIRHFACVFERKRERLLT
jgi:hypothetical protein